MDAELYAVIQIMGQVHAKDISVYDETFLVNSLERRLAVTGIQSAAAYCTYLEKTSFEADAFFSSLHITFSQFCREPLQFALLDQRILPRIMADMPVGSEIRVWSAGCACGQEAYSIAMLLNEHICGRANNLKYRIFATDISKNALAVAKKGIYDWASIQNVTMKQLSKYFTSQGETYSIAPHLKKNISFSYYNLLDFTSANPPESIFGDFDVIFCCNLLMYYKPDLRLALIKKLDASLSATGVLIVGEAEKSIVENTARLRSISTPTPVFQHFNHAHNCTERFARQIEKRDR